MARLKAQVELEQERLETLQKLTSNYPIEKYTKRPALVYSRYSTAKQVRDSIAAGLQQSEKLLQRADDLGWERSLLTLLVENQMTKDGRIRSVSGTIPIEDRAGMQVVIDRVKAGAGAIICDDISRLTRDADLVDATSLAKTCKEHDCIIVTSERVYNFKRKADFDAYIDEARAAAAFIDTHIRNKMLKNRARKAEQGKLATGVAPVGLLAVGEKRSELVPSPHASRVDWLYARFRAHEASLNGLLREVLDMMRRGEVLFPVCDEVDPKSMFLTPVEQDGNLLGWTVTSRFGLKHILTNPAYIGHLVFNGRIVKRNAHETIVDAANWQYAFDHLASVDLDGQLVERSKKTVRYTQQTSTDNGALLSGTRHNGTAVIDGLNDLHVFVRNTPIPTYTLEKWSVGGYETSIRTTELDAIFEAHLLDWLGTSEVLASLQTKAWVIGFTSGNVVEIPPPKVHEMAYGVNATKQTAKPDDTMTTLNEDIAETERNIQIGGKYMEDNELEAAYAKLARLRKRRTAIEQARNQQAAIEAEIRQAASDVCLACNQWHGWDIARKRGLIRLVTEAVTLEEIAVGWLRLTIKWSPVLGGLTEQCYIWRSVNNKWTDDDLEALRDHYPAATKNQLLDMFPMRSWGAIIRQASERGIKRVNVDSEHVQNDIRRNDVIVADKYNVSVGKRVQWVVTRMTNDGLLS